MLSSLICELWAPAFPRNILAVIRSGGDLDIPKSAAASIDDRRTQRPYAHMLKTWYSTGVRSTGQNPQDFARRIPGQPKRLQTLRVCRISFFQMCAEDRCS